MTKNTNFKITWQQESRTCFWIKWRRTLKLLYREKMSISMRIQKVYTLMSQWRHRIKKRVNREKKNNHLVNKRALKLLNKKMMILKKPKENRVQTIRWSLNPIIYSISFNKICKNKWNKQQLMFKKMLLAKSLIKIPSLAKLRETRTLYPWMILESKKPLINKNLILQRKIHRRKKNGSYTKRFRITGIVSISNKMS